LTRTPGTPHFTQSALPLQVPAQLPAVMCQASTARHAVDGCMSAERCALCLGMLNWQHLQAMRATPFRESCGAPGGGGRASPAAPASMAREGPRFKPGAHALLACCVVLGRCVAGTGPVRKLPPGADSTHAGSVHTVYDSAQVGPELCRPPLRLLLLWNMRAFLAAVSSLELARSAGLPHAHHPLHLRVHTR